MTKDLYASIGLSSGTINSLAKATRSLCDISDDNDFDIVRFLEVDLVRIMPEFHLFIEEDIFMNGHQAFVTNESTAIVVSESVYNDACAGYFYARKILAHEFGHILLHHNMNRETKHHTRKGYSKEIEKMETYHSCEWQADTFAVLLLVPQCLVSRPTCSEEIMQRYRISPPQAAFVSGRLNSVRRRRDTTNHTVVRSMIERFLRRFQLDRKPHESGTGQLSFFV